MKYPGLAVYALLALLLSPCTAATFEELSAQAAAARQANQTQQAIALYKDALALKPAWTQGLWFLGTLLYETADYSGSRDTLRSFTTLLPKSGPGWALLGLSEYQAGDYQQALASIQKGMALGAANEPNFRDLLRYHEAMLLTRSGDFDGALRKYAPFAEAAGANAELQLAIGIAALRRPLIPREVAPQDRELFTLAGQAVSLTMTGRGKEAQPVYAKLVERFPSSPNVHYLYGSVLLHTDPDAGIDELKRELEAAPTNAAASAMLALGLLTRGDMHDALPHAEKAFAGDPKSPLAAYVLGRALSATGDAARGVRYLETAVAMEPDNLEHHLALAVAYPKAGRYADAKKQRAVATELWYKRSQVAQP